MQKKYVGKVENRRVVFFWLLVGGGIGNLLLAMYPTTIWPILMASAVLSILVAVMMADQKQRPKAWLRTNLLITSVLLILITRIPETGGMSVVVFVPSALLILGYILGINDW